MDNNFKLNPSLTIDTSIPQKISIRLKPQLSLFRTETKVVLMLLIFFSWLIGVGFFLLGAWPVLIFLSADIALIYYFLRKGSSDASDLDEIDIHKGKLIIRKIRNAKCLNIFDVPAYWSRVELVGQKYGRSKLVVSFRDNCLEIASFLDWKTKVTLESYLNFELQKLKTK